MENVSSAVGSLVLVFLRLLPSTQIP